MRILAVNAGSTDVKLSVIDERDATHLEESASGTPEDIATSLAAFIERADHVDAVCHRIVHSGPELHGPVVMNDSVRRQLAAAASLAPLHMPPALRLLDLVHAQLDVPTVACFDTTFHAHMPPHVALYAIPSSWRALGVRRYGFQGLSCAWSLRCAAQTLRVPATTLRLVIAHLGGGCSVTAVRDGHGRDTTMGFSPLEGLIMASRSGSVDPAAVLWLQTAHGVTADALSEGFEHESGLIALAGTADMRSVVSRAEQGDAAAAVALDSFVHRVRVGIGAVAMSLDRIDAVVFTGGIGEGSSVVRDRVTAGGIHGGTFPRVLVVHAREDLEMTSETRRLLSGRSP